MKKKLAKVRNYILIASAWISAILMFLSAMCLDSEGGAGIMALKVWGCSALYLMLFIYANVRGCEEYVE